MKIKGLFLVIFVLILISTVVWFNIEYQNLYLSIKDRNMSGMEMAFTLFDPYFFGIITVISEIMLFSDIWYFLFEEEKTTFLIILHAVTLILETTIIVNTMITQIGLGIFYEWYIYMLMGLVPLKLLLFFLWWDKNAQEA